MRKLIFIVSLIMVPFLVTGSGHHVTPDYRSVKQDEVKVIYFHVTRRCATCIAVENVSRNYIDKVFGDRVDFSSHNLDKKESRELAEKYKVSGQALIVVKGDVKSDITGPAFMNALNKPQKLEELLFETINPLLLIE